MVERTNKIGQIRIRPETGFEEIRARAAIGKSTFPPTVTPERRPGMSPNPQMFAQDCSKEELRAICDGLFIPQRRHGIDAHGSARGQVSSNQTDRDHYRSGNDNRKRAGDWQVGDQAGG